jgi:flagellar basal-body rod protein FlgF
MDRALFLAMSGAKDIGNAQAIHANNLANASTNGFRADFAQARAMAIYGGDGHPTRTYALTERPGTNFEAGTVRETGGELDVAISGQGWIAVQSSDGSEAYTRGGSFHIDELGQLRDGSGRFVIGDGGPITIPPYEQLTIGQDGTITVQAQGQQANAVSQAGRLKLVNPDSKDLVKGADGLFRSRSGKALEPDPVVSVQSGFVEGSNVNVVGELTSIMNLARQFEMEVKMMRTMEDNSGAAARLLQQS